MTTNSPPSGTPERRRGQNQWSLPVNATLTYPCPVIFGRARAVVSSAASDTDAAEVARARGGDEAAFESLVRRREVDVYQLAFRVLGDREDALEAVQETFLRVFRSLGSFRGDASFRTWVYGIALNVCRNRLDSAEHRARRRAESLVIVDPDSGAEVERPLPDSQPGPEATAYGAELRRALEKGLTAISPEHREVLVLREIQGLEYEELAAVLGCALGTVKSRLARARAALRVALEGVWP
jgi:RNA polymerase sigma-70 factor, ECF subfamily